MDNELIKHANALEACLQQRHGCKEHHESCLACIAIRSWKMWKLNLKAAIDR